MERRFAAILAADAVGYSSRMSRNEAGALAALADARSVIDESIQRFGGRLFGSAGDSVIAEFGSSVKAIGCALNIQETLQERSSAADSGEPLTFRIGVNFGDVVVKGDDLLGEGVNIAARLEAIAPPGGVCVSSQVIDQVDAKLSAGFKSAGQHRLKNIRKPVTVWCWPAEKANQLRRRASASKTRFIAAAAALAVAAVTGLVYWTTNPGPESGVPTGPRIAVLPFKNIGADQANEYFSEGLTKDINGQLSKFTNLFVIAPSAVKEYQSNGECSAIRRELGADYILSGTVRRSSDEIRVTTNLTDAASCRQMASPGPFDRDLSMGNVLDIQLEIASNVVAQIGSADAPLFNADIQREIRNSAPEGLEAYECVLLSYWFYENFAPDRHRRARACLERSVREEPDFSLGWSRLAFSYIESKKYSIDTPQDWARLAREAAYKAIDIDPSNPDAYYALAILSQMMGEDVSAFRQFADKAVMLNPNDAFVLADLGTWMAYSGEWEKGKEWVSRAKLLNPKHQSWWDYIWHLHHYLKGEYAQARDVALKVNLPNNYMVQASLTASYAMNGEDEKARQTLDHLLEIRPDYRNDPRAPFRTRGMPGELVERLMDGLRKAGLDVPEAKQDQAAGQ
jgi:class 3 adenylate cyclase/TolB-like protein